MTLYDILKAKGSTVYTIHPDSSLGKVIQELVLHNVGALLVCDRDLCEGERVLGIITERDIIRSCATDREKLESRKVKEVMTEQLVTGSPTDSLEDVMAVMTNRRIRHLPVLVEGRLVGLVSIGDLVKTRLDQLSMENQFMKNYINS